MLCMLSFSWFSLQILCDILYILCDVYGGLGCSCLWYVPMLHLLVSTQIIWPYGFWPLAFCPPSIVLDCRHSLLLLCFLLFLFVFPLCWYYHTHLLTCYLPYCRSGRYCKCSEIAANFRFSIGSFAGTTNLSQDSSVSFHRAEPWMLGVLQEHAADANYQHSRYSDPLPKFPSPPDDANKPYAKYGVVFCCILAIRWVYGPDFGHFQ